MLKTLSSLTPYLDFIRACQDDPSLRDPMLLSAQQLRCNLLDAPENPAMRVLGTFAGDTLTGIFSFLVLPDERYLELLAGLSGCSDAWEEILSHLQSAYPGWQADFVFNPRNRVLCHVLQSCGAAFAPEQQKLLLRHELPYTPDARVIRYTPRYRAQYLALHTADRYWTGERVLEAPQTFLVLLAIEGGSVAGYLDLSRQAAVNEPYDLFVRRESRRKGLGRALLAAAIEQNRPNGMMLLVDIDNTAAIRLYESLGFVKAEGENNITASLQL